MRKNEINWAVFSGKILLPFTIRSTKKQCIFDYLNGRGSATRHERPFTKSETCKKIVINEYTK
jgi:hypothetical protein